MMGVLIYGEYSLHTQIHNLQSFLYVFLIESHAFLSSNNNKENWNSNEMRKYINEKEIQKLHGLWVQDVVNSH